MSAQLKFNPAIKIIPKLTDRQKDLLLYICEYLGNENEIPTHLQICRHLNVKTNNAGPYLNPLAKKGYLEKAEGIGFIPTEDALTYLDRNGHHKILAKIAIRDGVQGDFLKD